MDILRLVKLGYLDDKLNNLSNSEKVILNMFSTLKISQPKIETYLNYIDDDNENVMTYEYNNKLLIIHYYFIIKFLTIYDNLSIEDCTVIIESTLKNIFINRLGFKIDVFI